MAKKNTNTKKEMEGDVRSLRRDLKKAEKQIEDLARAKAAAAESEQRWRLLFENVPDIIIRTDRKGKLLGINRTVTGLKLADVIGKRIYDFIDKAYWHMVKATLKKVFTTGKPGSYEILGTGPRGSGTAWYETRVLPVIEEGEVIAVTQISVDITEGKRVQEALRESESKFRNLAEQSPNMIFINRGGRVVYVNEKCCEIMGYTRREFYSEGFDFVSLIAPRHQGLVRKNFQRHMQGKRVGPHEYDIVTKPEKVLGVVINSELMKYEGAWAILGTVTDITEQKVIQRKLRKAAADLNAQKKALQEKNATLKEVLAQIEAEKYATRKQVSVNVDKLIRPLVRQLKGNPRENRTLELLERRLDELTSGFGPHVSERVAGLTPRELEICNMIRSSMSSKEIAELLNVSLRTIETHRNHIRKKLGISRKDVNFAAYLDGLE